ncbi:hypothetical protein BC831DRAFT_461814, partial [Entophlyctis helioformis]
LAGTPWTPLNKDNETLPSSAHTFHTRLTPQLYTQSAFTRNSYVVLVSDFRRVWWEKADTDAVRDKLRRSNPNLAATPLDKILAYVRNFLVPLEGSPAFKYDAHITGHAIDLSFRGSIGSLPFEWQFDGRLARPDAESGSVASDLLFRSLVSPMFEMLQLYADRTRRLMAMVESRDMELQAIRQRLGTAAGGSAADGGFDRQAFDEAGVDKNSPFEPVGGQGLPQTLLANEDCGRVCGSYTRASSGWLHRDTDKGRGQAGAVDGDALPEGQELPVIEPVDEEADEAAKRLEQSLLRDARRHELELAKARDAEKRKRRRL